MTSSLWQILVIVTIFQISDSKCHFTTQELSPCDYVLFACDTGYNPGNWIISQDYGNLFTPEHFFLTHSFPFFVQCFLDYGCSPRKKQASEGSLKEIAAEVPGRRLHCAHPVRVLGCENGDLQNTPKNRKCSAYDPTGDLAPVGNIWWDIYPVKNLHLPLFLSLSLSTLRSPCVYSPKLPYHPVTIIGLWLFFARVPR